MKPSAAKASAAVSQAPSTIPPAAPRGRPSSREAMLDAAVAVTLEQGASRLTLDAVAKRAGVSKGGVMYNFPTKEALLEALLERLTQHNRQAGEAIAAALPDVPGRALQAYVLNSIRDPDDDDRVSGALAAVVNGSPALLKRVAGYFAKRFDVVSQDVPFERAALAYIATEGLWLMELFGVSPFNAVQRSRIVELLTDLAAGRRDALPDRPGHG
ncbi:TetR/AcrR family transcriptional regulator [Hydrocarboniphaga daqingensis]|uniref:TetR/AcrR family transcriptional regulator n=1 Tax=Hydrocarboniphaga daqingensis TaxID=490188 RepID=UPI001FEAAF47|nr:TetR/AcrR family transcriptional regulator [Hydrocarboniphaga daqingensis]